MIEAVLLKQQKKPYEDIIKFHRVNSTQHTYHLLAAQVLNGERDKLIRYLFEEKGVQTIVQYYPLYRYDFYKKLGFSDADCPNTDDYFDNMISFPFHHCLSDEDFDFLLASTKEALSLV